MSGNIWDRCQIDGTLTQYLDDFSKLGKGENSKSASASFIETKLSEATTNLSSLSPTSFPSSSFSSSSTEIYQLQHSLSAAEQSGRHALQHLDELLQIIHQIRSAYDDVTGRTNSLMSKCESLLDQQHTLQTTVEVLQKAIQPFDDIENIAMTLGIPYEGTQKSPPPTNGLGIPGFSSSISAQRNASEIGISNLDPRSPEFQDILLRLTTAVNFLKEHPEIMEADRYRIWLDKLQTRAVSLVGRAMRDIVDKAAKACREVIQQKLYNRVDPQKSLSYLEETPLESTPVYQKFRGLSYRMKELTTVLIQGGLGGPERNIMDSKHSYSLVVSEVRKNYAIIRVELLMPFIKESWLVSLAHTRAQHMGAGPTNSSGTNLASIVEEFRGVKGPNTSNSPKGAAVDNSNVSKGFLSLSAALRQVFSTLIRVTQLEHQLFESLFAHESASTQTSGDINGLQQSRQRRGELVGFQEILQIIDALSNATRDFLRPLIIRESSVDELCRLISVLREDMQSQITVLPIPQVLTKHLISSLDSTINDAKERVTYCAETKLRQEVQMFEPLPSHLAYPDILENFEEAKKSKQSDSGEVEDAYQTWYPPMRQTLSLLSKLYGVVAPPIFEDFARRGIELCIQSLRVGADGVKRTHPAIHGDLFLVRHLLILREQLMPFEIRLQSIEKHLDFSNTGQAFNEFVYNSRNMLRFDQTNVLWQFARQGLPGMQEMYTDAKKELDVALKKACIGFKQSAMKMLLGPLDAFMAKVSAFLGDSLFQAIGTITSDMIDTPAKEDDPSSAVSRANRLTPQLSQEAKNLLHGQAFVRPERMKESLEQMQTILVQRMPDIKDMMRIYIDSIAARNILQKSIVQDFEIMKRKMECVLMSCVDPGQAQQEIDQLLQSIGRSITTDLGTSQ